jgi:hypothetical protein
LTFKPVAGMEHWDDGDDDAEDEDEQEEHA